VIFSERLYAALPSSHALASLHQIDLKEMRSEPFLLLKEGHCFRANAITACKRSRVKPRVVFESGQFSTILAMVAAGMGVSIVPAMAVEKRNDCRFVPIRDQQATRNVGLVELKHRCPTRAQQALVQHLKKATGSASARL
jgi:LysR family transcriptional regulator, hydrogen peroxide-inducible genes activator